MCKQEVTFKEESVSQTLTAESISPPRWFAVSQHSERNCGKTRSEMGSDSNVGFNLIVASVVRM